MLLFAALIAGAFSIGKRAAPFIDPGALTAARFLLAAAVVGGALLAFQSAFFIAGARSVLCSLWPIDDQATARWMSEFYTQYHNGHSSDEALAKAQRLVLADPDYYHPAFWAAFSCNSR